MSSLLSTAISIFSIICMWMVFEKAGEPGWQAIIPVWNAWVLAKIANKKWTFWVQMIASGLLVVSILVITVLAFTTLSSNQVITDDFYYGDEYYYDEYDEYDYYGDEYEYYGDEYDFEDDYSTSELSLVKKHNIANLSSYDEYYDYDSDFQDSVAELDEAIGEIGIMIALGILIPFVIMLPMIAVSFIQNMGLAKAFGQHWAFALLLTFVNPVGMGILAFSDNIQYVGDDFNYTPSPAPAAAGAAYSAADYRPVEPVAPAQPANNNDYHAPGYQSTDYNPFEPSSNARVAPDVSEMPLRQQDTIPQVKHHCPNCGFESDRVPNPDTFCPNCGYLYRA